VLWQFSKHLSFTFSLLGQKWFSATFSYIQTCRAPHHKCQLSQHSCDTNHNTSFAVAYFMILSASHITWHRMEKWIMYWQVFGTKCFWLILTYAWRNWGKSHYTQPQQTFKPGIFQIPVLEWEGLCSSGIQHYINGDWRQTFQDNMAVLKKSGINHTVTWYHKLDEQRPQMHHCKSLETHKFWNTNDKATCTVH
jgi:hypothetical protein